MSRYGRHRTCTSSRTRANDDFHTHTAPLHPRRHPGPGFPDRGPLHTWSISCTTSLNQPVHNPTLCLIRDDARAPLAQPCLNPIPHTCSTHVLPCCNKLRFLGATPTSILPPTEWTAALTSAKRTHAPRHARPTPRRVLVTGIPIIFVDSAADIQSSPCRARAHAHAPTPVLRAQMHTRIRDTIASRVSHVQGTCAALSHTTGLVHIYIILAAWPLVPV